MPSFYHDAKERESVLRAAGAGAKLDGKWRA
jgi:hypothetical protein